MKFFKISLIILLILFSIIISGILYLKYIFSCNYLYRYDSQELIALLSENSNKLFLLTQSMRSCQAKNYNDYLIKALNYHEQGGHILIFKTESTIGSEANVVLNIRNNTKHYYYNNPEDYYTFNLSHEQAQSDTEKSILRWNMLYKQKKL
jgi:hypothetical protein